MADRKELDRLIGVLIEQGFDVKRTTKGHFTVRTESGEYVTTLAGTPSEYRGWRNALSALKRAGYEPPG